MTHSNPNQNLNFPPNVPRLNRPNGFNSQNKNPLSYLIIIILTVSAVIIWHQFKKKTDGQFAEENLKQTISKYTKSFQSEDFASCMSMMWPKAVKASGGSAKVIEALKMMKNTFKEIGMVPIISGYKASYSGSIIRYSEDLWGSVVNTTLPVFINNEEGIIIGSEIALTYDKGETWFLLSGSSQGKTILIDNHPELYQRLDIPRGVLKVGGKEVKLN